MRWDAPAFSGEKRGRLAAQRPERVIFPSLIQGQTGHNGRYCIPAGSPAPPCPCPARGTGSRGGGQPAQPAPNLLAELQGSESKEIFLGESCPSWRWLDVTRDGMARLEVLQIQKIPGAPCTWIRRFLLQHPQE